MVDGQPAEAGTPARRRVWRYAWIFPFVFVGLVVRLLAVGVWFPSCPEPEFFGQQPPPGCFTQVGWGDAFYFTTQANLLAEGEGFVNPTTWFLHETQDPSIPKFLPGAGHPPVYTVTLAALYKLGLDSPSSQRWVFPFVGALGVLLVGMAAQKIGGRRARAVGAIAAAIAALYPMLWINDFRYLSESVYIPIIAVYVMTLYRFWRSPSLANAALVGGVLGVIGLTRGEGFFILAMTVPPLLWGLRDRSWGWRIQAGIVTGAVMGAVMLPWVAYNVSRFDPPMLITSGTGMVLLHGSCDEAFYGESVGYYSFSCAESLPSVEVDPYIHFEEEQDLVGRELSTSYISENLGRLPVVMAARAGRMWDVYDPVGNVELNDRLEGRGYWTSMLGLISYWLLMPAVIYGAVVLRRRSVPISPLVGMAIAVTITAAISFGVTRYRVPVEVPFVMFAAVGIDAFVARLRGRMQPGEPGSEQGTGPPEVEKVEA